MPARALLRGLTILVAGTFFAAATGYAADAEQTCQKARYSAAAKYAACQQKALAKLFGSPGPALGFQAAFSKCRVKYTATWAKLQAKAAGSGSTCDNGRYQDNGDGTVTDRLTGLQWEQKTDDATVHDKDNSYSWSASPLGLTADGEAFTTFLRTLNSVCFAGQCDWRLPTIYELATILLGPYPCSPNPCIDQTVFGPTGPGLYWSATSAHPPETAWLADFVGGGGGGSVGNNSKTFACRVRAVRLGL